MANRRTTETLQGIAALLGITLGAIPLLRVVFGGEVGRWLAWLPATDQDPGRWLVPTGIVLVCVAAIGLLERQRD